MPSRGVLHVIIDDLRPELGAYGLADRATPVMDELAAGGVTFDRAFAQIAVCGPSRNSFMTGRRPDESRTWNFINSFREDHPEWTTIPGLFLRAGGVALGVGKSFHPMMPPEYDGNRSWSAPALPYYNPCWNTAQLPSAATKCEGKAPSVQCDGGLPCVFCPIDVESQLSKWIFGHGENVSVANEYCSIDAWEDTLTTRQAVAHLRAEVMQASAAKLPWYLAVGMHKPHMPWQASPADWAKHPLESISLPKHQRPPIGMPPIAYHYSEASDHPSPWTPLPAGDVRAARRAYRAAVSGVDRKLGSLLAELDALGLAPTTAVVLHSDHGWHLGEGGAWRKFTCFEAATRVPLIIRVPWLASAQRSSGGGRADALVELVDVLPTVAALAGIELPPDERFDGASLLPLLHEALEKAPNESPVEAALSRRASSARRPRSAAYSQYPRRVTDAARPWHGNSIIHHARSTFTHMGYSIRTAAWRYTEWVPWNGTTLTPIWAAITARELYDHQHEASYPSDFDDLELENLAGHPEYNETVERLSTLLRTQFGNRAV